MVKAVMFDMDGTLLDTERLSVESWKQVNDRLGISLTDEVVESFIGRTREAVIDIIAGVVGDHDEAERIYALHRDIENQIAEHDLQLKPGAREALDALRDAGVSVGLATSSRLETARRNFTRFGLMDRFSTVTCGEDVTHGKPDPEMYLLAAQRAGISPAECAAVEDSPNGVRSAHAAGMHTFMVPDRIAPTPEIEALCDGVLESLFDLVPALERLG